MVAFRRSHTVLHTGSHNNDEWTMTASAEHRESVSLWCKPHIERVTQREHRPVEERDNENNNNN